MNWNLDGNANNADSLNDVINTIINFNGNSAVKVTSNMTVSLAANLPTILKPLALTGKGLLTTNGAGAGASTSGLVLGANGIKLSGITLRNFGGAAIGMLNGVRTTSA